MDAQTGLSYSMIRYCMYIGFRSFRFQVVASEIAVACECTCSIVHTSLLALRRIQPSDGARASVHRAASPFDGPPYRTVLDGNRHGHRRRRRWLLLLLLLLFL